MPIVAPDTLASIPRAIRAKLQKALHERAVMGYTFSYERLFNLLTKVHGMTPDDANASIEGCIVAHDDGELKKVKAVLNDFITGVFAENGIKTLRDEDPFGCRKDYIYMESTSTALNRNRAIELAPKYGISPDTMIEVLDAATTRTPFTTLQARSVKEQAEEEAEVKAPLPKAAKRR